MCVQCCVHCMFTVCSMSASTRNRKNLQETIHLCNPVRPNLSHPLQTHNIPWHSGLTWPIPFILIPLRRCVKHGRVQWVGVLDVNVACGPKTKRNAFPRRTLSKVLSLQKLQRQSCKGGIQNTACYASHAFLHRPHTFYDRYHALPMSWQWTYIERTLNMQWTRHRTLRKLRERANRWKSKENSIFVLFSENHNQLHRFAAICSFLDCVQCVFNVAFTVCSLYVQCQLPPETEKTYKRPYTCVTLSDPTYPILSRHTTYLDTPDWPGLFPSYLSLCAGAWSMVACSEWVCWMWMWPAGRKQKEMLFRDGWWTKSCTST